MPSFSSAWLLLLLASSAVVSEPLNELVIFGASYCQSGDVTPAGAGPPGNPRPYYGGRYSNGLVFGEYMKNATGATLYDYGVGGAHIDPSLTQGGYYSSIEVEAYLQGIQDGTILYKKYGMSLHVWWVGLNPIKEGVWANLTAQPEITDQNLAYANQQAALNAQAVLGQATTVAAALEQYSDINAVMLLLPIPPTELVPQTKYGDTNSTASLDALAELTDTFNTGLFNGSSAGGNKTSSFLYWAADNWWTDLSHLDFQARGPYNGTSLSLNSTDSACLTLRDGSQCAPCDDAEETVECSNPDDYLYWDALHPTTVVQQDLAILLLDWLQVSNATSAQPEPASGEAAADSSSGAASAKSSTAGDASSPATHLKRPLLAALLVTLSSSLVLFSTAAAA